MAKVDIANSGAYKMNFFDANGKTKAEIETAVKIAELQRWKIRLKKTNELSKVNDGM